MRERHKVRQGFEGIMLLPSKIEKGAINQGISQLLDTLKVKGTDSLLQNPDKTQP